MTIYILADLHSDGKYYPNELSSKLEAITSNLEYQDVSDISYQIWEYPSGRIYDVRSDRVLDSEENQYATPYGAKGKVWEPTLVEVKVDVDIVNAAYATLSK